MDDKERGPQPKFRLDTERFKQEVAEEIAASLRERGARRQPAARTEDEAQ